MLVRKGCREGKRSFPFERLLKILACPKCKRGVELKKMFLICKECKLAFPIVEEIPDMLITDAWKLIDAEKSGFEHNLKL